MTDEKDIEKEAEVTVVATPSDSGEPKEEGGEITVEKTAPTEEGGAPQSKHAKMMLILEEKGIDTKDPEAVADYMEKMHGDYDGMQNEVNSIIGPLRDNPMAAKALSHLVGGGDPIKYLVELIGADKLKEALDNPETLDEIVEANKAFIAKASESDEFEAEVEANQKASAELLEAYAEEKGISQDEALNMFLYLDEMGKKSILGTYDADDFDLAFKALKFDDSMKEKEIQAEIDVADAEVRGKNAKIGNELKKDVGGMPSLEGGGGGIGSSKKRKQRIPWLEQD